MPISLIASVIQYRNQLVIGKDNKLLVKLKKDLEFFKNITSNNTQKDIPNIVLMGCNTYYSIPINFRPLKNRLNFVLSNNPLYLKEYPLPKKLKDFSTERVYFLTLLQFQHFYQNFNPNVFVIGGGQIYNLFLNHREFIISNLYITEVNGYKLEEDSNLITMNHFDDKYRLISYSEKYKQENISYRILSYKFINKASQEHLYFDLARDILRNGNERLDRTATGTISLLGTQLRFDISTNFPLLTTKQISFKAIVEELLFFCRGDTDAKILDNRGVKIWNGNTTREFLNNRGLSYSEGIMGPMYGYSFRHFGAKYSEDFADTSKCDTSKIGGFDQLVHIENLLKTDPFSRRIYISNLNPAESSKMVLEPCHTYIQFYVTEENGEKYLSAWFNMRSSDSLAWCYNICSYDLLVRILALKCNMKPKEIIYNAVDCHIYKNHINQIKEQMTRIPRPLPCVKLSETIKIKDWVDIKYEDFELIGYMPHPRIKMKMAV